MDKKEVELATNWSLVGVEQLMKEMYCFASEFCDAHDFEFDHFMKSLVACQETKCVLYLHLITLILVSMEINRINEEDDEKNETLVKALEGATEISSAIGEKYWLIFKKLFADVFVDCVETEDIGKGWIKIWTAESKEIIRKYVEIFKTKLPL